jgi:hypothetical protein
VGGDATADIPGDLTWIIVFAAVGFGVSVALRRRVGIYVGVLGLVFAVGFVAMPQARLWNARLLPFWYLSLYLLAALAVYEIAHALAVLLAKDVNRPLRWPVLAAPLVAVLGMMVFLGMGLRSLDRLTLVPDSVPLLPEVALPLGGSESADGTTYSWMGIDSTDRSYIPDWARWNFSGYEEKPAYPEFRALVATMAELGEDPEHGCGRAMWEYESQLDRFGTPMALMLLPYFTDECIGSMEGLYFEASATTPYHFLNQSELSAAPSNAQRDLRYQGLNVHLGVQHLQLMGVKYYMAFSEGAVSQADANDDLVEVAQSAAWHIYEIDKGGREWQDMAESWYLDPSQWDVLRSVSGPDEWPRITSGEVPPTVSVDRVKVSNVEQGTSTVSFDVSDVGTPVLVKTSYFPNWEASGADGPWRVAPNFMVVVPTSEHVELRYGRTPVDWVAWLVTVAGVALAIVLWRRPALVVPDPVQRRWRRRRESVDADEAEELALPDHT